MDIKHIKLKNLCFSKSNVRRIKDKNGNYYQQIALQDATGGVLLRLAGNNLFNQYPVGRKLFVKLKGLYLGQYNGTLQFGGGIDSAFISQGGVTLLAFNLFDQHIVKGPLNQPLTPKVVSVSELTTSLQDPHVSTLIQLSEMEASPADTARNYADASQSGNRILQGCTSPSTNRITLRTSNYANFATVKMPAGNGTITGVYSYFGTTKQLTIRDTSDVRFSGARCGSGPATILATSELRALYNGASTFAPAGRKITGVVISGDQVELLVPHLVDFLVAAPPLALAPPLTVTAPPLAGAGAVQGQGSRLASGAYRRRAVGSPCWTRSARSTS